MTEETIAMTDNESICFLSILSIRGMSREIIFSSCTTCAPGYALVVVVVFQIIMSILKHLFRTLAPSVETIGSTLNFLNLTII